MQTSNDVLDAIAERYRTDKGPASDYRIAKLLDVTPPRISSIRSGKLFISKSLAIKAAELLGIEPGPLVAIATAERETNEVLKASLLRMARHALTVVIVLCISAPLSVAGGRAADALCILC